MANKNIQNDETEWKIKQIQKTFRQKPAIQSSRKLMKDEEQMLKY